MSQEIFKDQDTCFVIIGFGKKVNPETNKEFDLDKSYEYIIKPAVEAAGLKCIRADEIVHSGVIHEVMYKHLFEADVVIADLSTLNKNAFYELGVRHALKPFTTIIIAEDGIKELPFDINNINIRKYQHKGEVIDYGVVVNFRKELTEAITAIRKKDPRDKDSPVYTFLKNLMPPISNKQKDYGPTLEILSDASVEKMDQNAKNYAVERDEANPDFWNKTAQSSGFLLKLMRAATIDEINDCKTKIIENHLKAWETEGSADKYNAIGEHADFVISMFTKFKQDLQYSVPLIDEKIQALDALKQQLG